MELCPWWLKRCRKKPGHFFSRINNCQTDNYFRNSFRCCYLPGKKEIIQMQVRMDFCKRRWSRCFARLYSFFTIAADGCRFPAIA